MRFYSDNPLSLTPVVWYFVPANRPFVPYANPFVQRVWERAEEQPALGELQGEHSYYNGTDRFGLPGFGLCGSADQWEHGALTTDPLPPIDPVTGQPMCCLSGLVASRGGLIVGGRSSMVGPISSRGGLVEGGTGELGPGAILSFGGLVEGGTGELGPGSLRSDGGLVEGGKNTNQLVVESRGGMVEGGAMPQQPRVPIGVCGAGASISTKIVWTKTATTGNCSCLPAAIHFVWNGNVWQSITSSATCTGGNTNTWFCSRVALAGNKWASVRHGTFAANALSATCPPNATETFTTVTDTAWCGTPGTWSATLTEE